MQAVIKTIWNLRKNPHFAAWFVVWLLIYLVGFGAYYFGCQAKVWSSAFHAFKLFTFSVFPSPRGASGSCGDWIYLVGIVATAFTFISIFLVAYRQLKNTWLLFQHTREPYILVLGLGDKAAAYIDSELEHDPDQPIVAIEIDPNNPHVETYRDRGVAVQIADARDKGVLEKLHLDNVRYIVALTGNNADNLEIALILKELLSTREDQLKNLYVRNDDPALMHLYREGGLLDDSSHLLVHMFSIARNSARELFDRHPIDGESQRYMRSGDPFGIVVAGESPLAIEVVGQICELAYLPLENQVTIYCLVSDAGRYRERIVYRYPQIDAIPTISIEYLELHPESPDCYAHEVWQAPLTHVVLAHEVSRDNIAMAAELIERTYLEQAAKSEAIPPIHIALYEERLMAEEIDANEEVWRGCDTFATTSRMASRTWIVDEQGQALAKRIHMSYQAGYQPETLYDDVEEIERKWLQIDVLNDRPSNLAQADHLPLKLKAMDLRSKSSNMPPAELLAHNRKMLDQAIGEELKALGLDDDALRSSETFDFFPASYDTLVEQLLRAEHNRWNAYHFLRGWKYNDTKDKTIKHHNCLVPLSDLPNEMRSTVLYDLYSILYIPNLLASVGYELTEADYVG